MAQPPNRGKSQPLIVGPTSSRMIRADEVFQEVNNFYPTEEGTFRSCLGVWPYVHPTTGAGKAPQDAATPAISSGTYGPMHGVHHALLENAQREVLLVHTGQEVWELHGWDNSQKWNKIIGSGGKIEDTLPRNDIFNQWPTQFVTTPRGVVIIPQEGSAYFYDGCIVAPLGFTTIPGAPTGRGPQSSRPFPADDTTNGEGEGINDTGYAYQQLFGRASEYDSVFGSGRIGTVETLPNVAASSSEVLPFDEALGAGQLLEGRWRARVAWIDPWGNISALSRESADVTCDRQPSTGLAPTGTFGHGTTAAGEAFWQNARSAKFHILWAGFGGGPDHCIAKNLYRTKDILQTGDTGYYIMANDAQQAATAFASIPDPLTRVFPDNIPDGWLAIPAPDLDPVPVFRLAALAFGRLWVANMVGAPASLRPSVQGLFGTFEQGRTITPDPTGGQITGVHTVPQGLLVFTETSTFLIVPNDSGDDFRVMTLSSTVGCMAPSSIATTRFGMTIWLGRDGFYGFDGQQVNFLFQEHRDLVRQMNRGRMAASHAVFNPNSGQYECWVAWEDSFHPDRRFKFNGDEWHWDDRENNDFTYMVDSCVTADHRSIVLGAGSAPALNTSSGSLEARNGLWALDHGHDALPAKLVTGWIRATNSDTKASIRRARLWLRETGQGSLTISVRRNWRAEVTSTSTVVLYPEIKEDGYAGHGFQRVPGELEKNPDFWDVDATNTAIVRRRRPFWTHRTIDVPTCEVFQLQVDSTLPVEVVGISYDYELREDASANRRGT